MAFRSLMVFASMLLWTVGFGLCVTPLGLNLFFPALPVLSNVASGPADQVWYGVAFMRLFGASVAGLGFVTWSVRGVSAQETQTVIARGVQHGVTVGFFVALAQEVTVLRNVPGAIFAASFLAMLVGVVYWRLQHSKADPYGAVSVRV